MPHGILLGSARRVGSLSLARYKHGHTSISKTVWRSSNPLPVPLNQQVDSAVDSLDLKIDLRNPFSQPVPGVYVPRCASIRLTCISFLRMWLLRTDCAELEFVASPEEVAGRYAILSHVWQGEEQTFQEVRAIADKCKVSHSEDHLPCASLAQHSPRKTSFRMHAPQLSQRTRRSVARLMCRPLSGSVSKREESPTEPPVPLNPRDLVSPKIQQLCLLAEKQGYRWAWADTCCIDKTSSAELSEAINSMFRYYSLAGVCYAYLTDVPRSSGIGADSKFRRSLWHKRGWTLQELVASKSLVFLSCEWAVLGTKMELAETLESITKVPASVLRFETDVADISVARRMSWAAWRETTRPEDEAYCLMGIFGINMPTLYGEGKKAFYRLQEEIMKTSIDTSLFAWGDPVSTPDIAHDAFLSPGDHSTIHSSAQSYLFAPSPDYFDRCHSVEFGPQETEKLEALQVQFRQCPPRTR